MTIKKSRKPVNAGDFLMKEYVTGRPDMELLLCEEAENSRIAESVYSMREASGLTQEQLADRVGTKKSAISRLEDADYEGHSLGMLKRIADVLGYKVNLSFEKKSSRTQQTNLTRNQKRASNQPKSIVAKRAGRNQ